TSLMSSASYIKPFFPVDDMYVAFRIRPSIHSTTFPLSIPKRSLARSTACLVGLYFAITPLMLRQLLSIRIGLRANPHRRIARDNRNRFRSGFLHWISLVSSRFHLYNFVVTFVIPP